MVPQDILSFLYVDYDTEEHEATKFHCPFLESATGRNLTYQPTVREGDLIIFPSYILHEAPINPARKMIDYSLTLWVKMLMKVIKQVLNSN